MDCMLSRYQSKLFMPGRRHAERQCARKHREQAPAVGQQRQRQAKTGRIDGAGQGLARVQGDAAVRARHRQQPARQPGVRAQRLPLSRLQECCRLSGRPDCLRLGTALKDSHQEAPFKNQAEMLFAAAMGRSALGC